MAKVGDVIGNYRIVEELASGSFGSVYRGIHTVLNTRVVAVKILHMHLHLQQESESFFHEARILEALQHPHILHMFDVGMQEKMPYIVTAYAPGGSLRQHLNRQVGKPLPTNEALAILQQIALALDYAHQQNIIHRDLKPENILFDAQGGILLADFGISTILGSLSFHQTSPYGTPAYMSPEQFKGEVSRESDQYALACIAYELLTGQKPFTAPDVIALGFKHLTEKPIPPRKLNSSLPEYIDQAIIRALSKERKQRFHDVLVFLTAMQTPLKTSQQWFQEGDALREGNILRNLEQYEEALDAYRQAIRLDSHNAAAYNNMGLTLYHLGRHEEALDAFQQAIRLDPDYAAIAHNNMGPSLYYLARYEESLDAFQQAIRLNPTFAEAYNRLGYTFKKLKRYEEALDAFQQAIRISPTDTEAYNHMTHALLDLGRYEEALDTCQQCVRLEPTSSLFYHDIGFTLYLLGRHEEALDAFQQAIRLDSYNSDAYFEMGTTLAELNRYEEALDAYQQALDLDPSLADTDRISIIRHDLRKRKKAKKARELG